MHSHCSGLEQDLPGAPVVTSPSMVTVTPLAAAVAATPAVVAIISVGSA